MYKVLIANSAQKSARNIPNDYWDIIINCIFELAENPRPRGCKKLAGAENTYRIRVRDYRVIYTITDEILIVEVIKIGHRKNIYN
jgi:mRNA interferase RelE/StbE